MGKLPSGWEENLPGFQQMRKAWLAGFLGKVLNALAPKLPELFGRLCGLSSLHKTWIDSSKLFPALKPGEEDSMEGRNVPLAW
jgi:transketolase